MRAVKRDSWKNTEGLEKKKIYIGRRGKRRDKTVNGQTRGNAAFSSADWLLTNECRSFPGHVEFHYRASIGLEAGLAIGLKSKP